jgi:hypothetical protein
MAMNPQERIKQLQYKALSKGLEDELEQLKYGYRCMLKVNHEQPLDFDTMNALLEKDPLYLLSELQLILLSHGTTENLRGIIRQSYELYIEKREFEPLENNDIESLMTHSPEGRANILQSYVFKYGLSTEEKKLAHQAYNHILTSRNNQPINIFVMEEFFKEIIPEERLVFLQRYALEQGMPSTQADNLIQEFDKYIEMYRNSNLNRHAPPISFEDMENFLALSPEQRQIQLVMKSFGKPKET